MVTMLVWVPPMGATFGPDNGFERNISVMTDQIAMHTNCFSSKWLCF